MTLPVPPTQKAIILTTPGDPSTALLYRPSHPTPQPSPGQVLVKNAVAGINYIDTYFRTGLYPCPTPTILGREAAGVVVALGPPGDSESHQYHGLRVGDPVVWLADGGYAEYSAVPAGMAVRLPDGLSFADAAAAFMSGLTALALTRETYRVRAGDWVLLHAAAGGVGLLMTQVLKKAGARVIATAGGREKVEVVEGLGADYVIDYRAGEGKGWVERVMEITSGEGVDVVYDSVGKDTWEGSLEVVKRKGAVVWFGNSSGPIPPLPLNRLSPKCVKIARPTLFGYIATRKEFEDYAHVLFELLTSRALKIKIHGTYLLEDVPKAHVDLESRRTMGKLLIRFD